LRLPRKPITKCFRLVCKTLLCATSYLLIQPFAFISFVEHK